MKNWSKKLLKEIETPENVVSFLKEIEEVCKKHNLSISHEDGHGAFEIEKFSEFNINWLKSASLE